MDRAADKEFLEFVRLVDLVTVVEVRALRQTVLAADILQRQIDGQGTVHHGSVLDGHGDVLAGTGQLHQL